MKFGKIILISTILSIILVSCKSEQRPEIQVGADECYNCKMIITQIDQSCGFFRNDKFMAYCSPSCLIADYDYFRKGSIVPSSHIYFTDYGSKKLFQSDSIHFLFTKSVPTVMNSGVLTFRSEKDARSLIKQPDEFITRWEKFRIIAGQPDRVVDI